MIPVQQTKTGKIEGNCLNACLASILEIPIWEVPEFSHDGDLWLQEIQEFLATKGLYYVQVEPDDPALQAAFQCGGTIWTTMEGTSPRGGPHAIVARNGKPFHDPHPLDGTGRGLVSVSAYGLLCKRFA